jgi:hypothetical protein
MSAVASKYDSGLQAENSGGIAAFEGKVGNLVRSKSMTHGRILGIDQGSRTGNLHGYRSASDLHGDV